MFKPLTNKEIKHLNERLEQSVKNPDRRIRLLLQDVLDPINVGSFFRTADAFGIEHIYLFGKTPTPPNSGISLTARGTERKVSWSHEDDFEIITNTCKQDNFEVVGVELVSDSVPYQEYQPQKDVCLVMGNEAKGIYKKYIEQIDTFVAIPMLGKGPSLNVNIAGAVVAAHMRFR